MSEWPEYILHTLDEGTVTVRAYQPTATYDTPVVAFLDVAETIDVGEDEEATVAMSSASARRLAKMLNNIADEVDRLNNGG